MTIRPEIVELLHAGWGNKAIARHLHMDTRPIAAARAELGLPVVKAGRRPAKAPIDLFWERTSSLDGGHLEWTGYRTNDGTPSITYGKRVLSARRIAFSAWYGRDPVGYVRPACGLDECVAPAHSADRPMREANRRADKAFPGIFGEVAS